MIFHCLFSVFWFTLSYSNINIIFLACYHFEQTLMCVFWRDIFFSSNFLKDKFTGEIEIKMRIHCMSLALHAELVHLNQ